MSHTFAAVCLLWLAASALPVAETIGWTDRDRQMHGPAIRYLANDTLSGLHAVWKTGYGEMRYNFRPRAQAWRWPNGVAVCAEPRNLGCLDVDITTGTAVISCDYLSRGASLMTEFADSASGAARFVERSIASGSRGPLVGAANYGHTKHIAERAETVYFHISLSGHRLGRVGPFPAYNLGVSRQIGRYGCIWTETDGPDAGKLWFQQTPNNGQQWYLPQCLSDSLHSDLNLAPHAATATYDSIRGHLVFAGNDGSSPDRVRIWHYCPYDTPAFRPVHDYEVPAGTQLGSLNLAADRPSIGANRPGHEYYVAWEQFDPLNTDPVTGLCRADIWASRSTDAGRTWGTSVRLTDPDSTSKRFPFLAEVVDDSLHIICFADRVAGLWEHGEGVQTLNPVVHLSVPVTDLPLAVAEPGLPARPAPALVTAAGIGREFLVQTATPGTPVDVLDCAGRRVTRLARLPCRWGLGAAPGVYFLRSNRSGSTRVTLVGPSGPNRD